jgi:hypothetical protein
MDSILPNSKLRLYWNCILAVLITYSLMAVPFKLSFTEHQHGFYHPLIDLFIDIMLFIDIILNLRTTYYSKGVLVCDRKKIKNNYLKGWFTVDCISAFPIDIIFIFFNWVPLFPAYSLIRIFRIFRIIRFFSSLKTILHFNISLMRMLILAYLIMIYVHWISCFWFFVGQWNAVHEANGWLVEHGLEKASIFSQYVTSLYWVITTMTTVGYGDITPTTDLEIIATMLVMVLGVSVYAYVIGNLASMIANLDSSAEAFQQKIDKIDDYLKISQVPKKTRARIHSYFDYLRGQNKYQANEDPLNGLPEHFKTEIALFLHEKTIKKVPLFEDCHPGIIASVVTMLKLELYLPGEYVIKEGEFGSSMYFVAKGEVEVLAEKETKSICTLSNGSFFGELALLYDIQRTATVKAKTHSEVYILHKENFTKILTAYPKFKERIQNIAEERHHDS